MIRKPDLRIDTQFFDDNLNGFNIPQAIKVTQSIDAQTFIKEGLNQDNTQQLVIGAIQTIEKIMSQRLFDNFVDCWNKLKDSSNEMFIRQNDTPYTLKGHKRQSPLVHDIATQEQGLGSNNNSMKGIVRQKILLHKLSGSQIDWLEEQRRKIKNSQILKSKRTIKKSATGETHLERAKVLQQIVDKLKYGRNNATNLINQIDNKQQDEQLHYKLNRLQRLMQDVHYSSIQKGYATQRKKYERQQSHASLSSDTQLQLQMKNELAEIKKQMEKIRLENQRILKQEQWKRSEIKNMALTKEEMKRQFEVLRQQINYFEVQKQKSEENLLRMQQQLSYNNLHKQQYQRQIASLSQRVKNNETVVTNKETIRQDVALQYNVKQPTRNMNQSSSYYEGRPVAQIAPQQLNRQVPQSQYANVQGRQMMIPSEPNPFGYSTFGTSQKKSQSINWQQNSQNIGGIHVPVGEIDRQGRQAADEWACC